MPVAFSLDLNCVRSLTLYSTLDLEGLVTFASTQIRGLTGVVIL